MSKSFKEIGTAVGELVAEKNAAYGDAFAKSGGFLRTLYPNGISPEQYDDMLGIVRVLDKLFRIATDRDALGETPWQDIAGYGILGTARSQKPAKGTKSKPTRRPVRVGDIIVFSDERPKRYKMEVIRIEESNCRWIVVCPELGNGEMYSIFGGPYIHEDGTEIEVPS